MSTLGTLGGRKHRGSTNGVLSGLGAVPSKYWADPRVKTLQGQLNARMSASGCTSVALKPDGLIGPSVCGALAWAKSIGAPPAAYTSAAADMDGGCKPFAAALKMPACPAPAAPAAPAAPVAVIATPDTTSPVTVVMAAPSAQPVQSATLPPNYAVVPPSVAAMAPAAPAAGMSTGVKIAIGVGAVALIGAALVLTKKKAK